MSESITQKIALNAELDEETRQLRAEIRRLIGVRAFRRTNAWDPSQIAIVARFIAHIPKLEP